MCEQTKHVRSSQLVTLQRRERLLTLLPTRSDRVKSTGLETRSGDSSWLLAVLNRTQANMNRKSAHHTFEHPIRSGHYVSPTSLRLRLHTSNRLNNEATPPISAKESCLELTTTYSNLNSLTRGQWLVYRYASLRKCAGGPSRLAPIPQHAPLARQQHYLLRLLSFSDDRVRSLLTHPARQI